MHIMKCQDFAQRFLYLRNLLILVHNTFVLFSIAACYRRSVGLFNRNKLCVISDDVFSLVSSFDDNFYICKTCGKKLNKNCIPCQAVCNMLEFVNSQENLEIFEDLKGYL